MWQQGKSRGCFTVTSKTFEKVEAGFPVNTLVFFPFFVPPLLVRITMSGINIGCFFWEAECFPTRGAGWLCSLPLPESVSCKVSYCTPACLLCLSTTNPAHCSVSPPGMALLSNKYEWNVACWLVCYVPLLTHFDYSIFFWCFRDGTDMPLFVYQESLLCF